LQYLWTSCSSATPGLPVRRSWEACRTAARYRCSGGPSSTRRKAATLDPGRVIYNPLIRRAFVARSHGGPPPHRLVGRSRCQALSRSAPSPVSRAPFGHARQSTACWHLSALGFDIADNRVGGDAGEISDVAMNDCLA